jgi:hypothetical protein
LSSQHNEKHRDIIGDRDSDTIVSAIEDGREFFWPFNPIDKQKQRKMITKIIRFWLIGQKTSTVAEQGCIISQRSTLCKKYSLTSCLIGQEQTLPLKMLLRRFRTVFLQRWEQIAELEKDLQLY